jgi:hypothetical protein
LVDDEPVNLVGIHVLFHDPPQPILKTKPRPSTLSVESFLSLQFHIFDFSHFNVLVSYLRVKAGQQPLATRKPMVWL